MKKLPTDLEILEAIYEEYFDDYAQWEPNQGLSEDGVIIPIDIPKLAAKLGTEKGVLFGRLYYHMENRYGYDHDVGRTKNVRVHFFEVRSAEPFLHNINFPYMTAILANLRHEHRTARNNFVAAAVSAIGALASAFFAAIALRAPQPAAVPEPVARPTSPAPNPGEIPPPVGTRAPAPR